MTEHALGRRAASPRRLPTILLMIMLMVGAGFGYVLNRFVNTSEVQIESADSPGAQPAFIPVADTEVIPQRPVHAIGHVVTGDTEGLYGGTETTSCDAPAIRTFLDTHPQLAQAWAGALRIQPSDISRYLDSLTALTLRTDTAVTNHGYRNGVATPFQSVLQAGTAVLVDAEGLPRVRCFCGNPLQTPVPAENIRYVGQPWIGFEPESVTVIAQAPLEVREFVVLDHDSDQVVTRPRATTGEADVPVDRPRQTQILVNFTFNTTDEPDLDKPDPNAVDPNAVDPNAVDPNAVDPNAVDPNAVDPNAVDPNAVDPNVVEPNPVEPNPVDPNAVDPNAVDPNAVDPNAVDPNAVDPNAVDPNAVDPNVVEPNVVEPNPVEPNPVDPNAVDPNAVDPNVVEPNAPDPNAPVEPGPDSESDGEDPNAYRMPR